MSLTTAVLLLVVPLRVHIAEATPPAARIAAAEVAHGVDRVHTFELPFTASHVALHWPGQPKAQVQLALSRDGVSFDRPASVAIDEVGESRANGETYGSLVVAAGAVAVQVTTDRPLPRVSVLALDSSAPETGGGTFGAGVASAVSQPTVVSRAGWGADESLRFRSGNEIWQRRFWPVQKLIVHHTVTKNGDPDPRATVRAIYYYHAVTQGWGDIGYNFLVDEAGNVYEGRYSRSYAAGEYPTGEDTAARGVEAGHARGFNAGTVGVAMLGTLTTQNATPAARDALIRLLAWKAERHRLDPRASSVYVNPVDGSKSTFANIAGHRDVNSTACPGDAFYPALPLIRERVAAATPYSRSCLKFVASNFDAPGIDKYAENLNGEWVQIKNVCSSGKGIGGWKIHDYGRKHTYTFPSGVSIGAGKTITLYSGVGTNSSSKRYWGRTYGAIWNNSAPEYAYLRNGAGTLKSKWTEY